VIHPNAPCGRASGSFTTDPHGCTRIEYRADPANAGPPYSCACIGSSWIEDDTSRILYSSKPSASDIYRPSVVQNPRHLRHRISLCLCVSVVYLRSRHLRHLLRVLCCQRQLISFFSALSARSAVRTSKTTPPEDHPCSSVWIRGSIQQRERQWRERTPIARHVQPNAVIRGSSFRNFTSFDPCTFAALMIPGFTTGVKREPGANPGLFLKL